MKNINKKMIGKEILIGFILLLCINNVFAFAVSSDYWSGNSLKLAPGETKEFSIILQNLVGTSDIRIKAVVTSGSEVLTITDSSDTYLVPAGEKINVNFRVTIPIDAEPGQIYNAKIDFSERRDSSSGEFGFGTAIGQAFDIVVPSTVSRRSWLENNLVILYLAIGIAVLLIIIFILRKGLKKILRKVMKGKSHKR